MIRPSQKISNSEKRFYIVKLCGDENMRYNLPQKRLENPNIVYNNQGRRMPRC